MDGKTISDSVARSVRRYLETLEDEAVSDLYELVLKEVEAPLLRSVLEHTDNNQSKTAEILGMNRATLRKKLRKYRLL